MKYSAIAALCAAPVVLAGRLQAEVVPRSEKMVARNEPPRGHEVNVGGHQGGGGGVDINISVTAITIIWVNDGGNAETKAHQPQKTFAERPGPAATHSIIVGGAGGLVYTPNSISAEIGDMVIFSFLSQNHTVTQANFETPCERLSGGQDSGFMANANNTVVPAPQMAMQVTVKTPLWFYCRQTAHCGKGMTFSINPTADKTHAMFQQMAIAQNGRGANGAITGGSPAPPPAARPDRPDRPSNNTVVDRPDNRGGDRGGDRPSPPANPPSYMSSGSGNGGGASCSCSCLCGVGAWPSPVQQGLGMFGGMSGSMPRGAING